MARRELDGAQAATPGAGDAVLVARNLSKTFGRVRALRSFDLQLGRGEIHGLVGANGSGKSTFIKILSGYFTPDPGGEVEVGGQPLVFSSSRSSRALGCRFVQQDLGLVDQLSVTDNLHLTSKYPTHLGTIRESAARRQAQEDLGRVGLSIDPGVPVATLSAAQRTGVAIARALRGADKGEVDLLVLDEPTATLPEVEVEQLLQTLRIVAETGIAVLYVTHRLDEIFQIAHRVTVLRDGIKVATLPTDGLDRKRLVHLLVGAELDEVRSQADSTFDLSDLEERAVVLSVAGLIGPQLDGVSFDVREGEVVGLAGVTGSGSDTALGAVFGSIGRESGAVRVDGRQIPPNRPDLAIGAGVGYLPPDRKISGGMMELPAVQNLTLLDLRPFWRGLRLHKRDEVRDARKWFDLLSVRPAGAIFNPLASFSGGNQQKILFAKWIRPGPRVLFLDEPTHGVDIGAKAEIHRQILQTATAGTAVVISSSDIDELEALCDRVLVFRRGGIRAEIQREAMSVSSISAECLSDELEGAAP